MVWGWWPARATGPVHTLPGPAPHLPANTSIFNKATVHKQPCCRQASIWGGQGHGGLQHAGGGWRGWWWEGGVWWCCRTLSPIHNAWLWCGRITLEWLRKHDYYAHINSLTDIHLFILQHLSLTLRNNCANHSKLWLSGNVWGSVGGEALGGWVRNREMKVMFTDHGDEPLAKTTGVQVASSKHHNFHKWNRIKGQQFIWHLHF